MFKYYVSKFSLILEPPPPTLRSCHLVLNSIISLGDHEISHGEISPGYQENLLVNKFPVLTPPLISVLVVLVVNSLISLGDHEISHREILLVTRRYLTVRYIMVTKIYK